MKIKRDFVTNSSSTSFVMIGFKLTDYEDEKTLDILRKKYEDLYIGYGQEDGAESDDEIIVGYIIRETSIDDLDYTESDYNSFASIFDIVKEFGLSEKDIKYITSVRMS